MRIVAFVLLSALLFPVPVAAATSNTWLAQRLSHSVSTRDAMVSVRAFDAAARAGGGNRAPGSPGFEMSREHLEGVLERAGYRVTTQSVPYREFTVVTESLITSPGARVRVLMAQYAPSTRVEGSIARVTAAGCAPVDYPPGTAIAVAPSGACTTAAKTIAASEAGVRALLVYDPSPVADSVIRRQATGAVLPVAFVSRRDGESLSGSGVLELSGRSSDATTVNVFAETAGGRADHVVMAGAHLDSGEDGPGINDNATSVSALVETAVRLAPHQHRVENRVRFAFWGAEELINVGSTHYVATRTPEELAAIRLYLNWELIASPNFVRFVVDGDDSDHPDVGAPAGPPGSGVVEAVLTQGYRVQGLPFRTADLGDIRSDQEPFARAGVPVGGAFGGVRGIKTADEATVFGGVAGQPYDPCYHQPCDDLSNVHVRALGEAMRAMAWAVGRFAVDDDLDG
ncbi:M28 family peptidase [Saccharothrix yanglingensis]|uniref:Peptidase M28 n=1 Tax=Saccharothrix yanglingensis TaxID=659496 RepID=A0ABU0X3F1_9PSEU|nr:M28 family peptidase [Saccharothrix yanglingensis]MDQ2586660.1 peptidase M28 [Saccharothrix yanglingensis]